MLSLQFGGEGDVQEKLEDIRIAASRSSPMMETINLVWGGESRGGRMEEGRGGGGDWGRGERKGGKLHSNGDE